VRSLWVTGPGEERSDHLRGRRYQGAARRVKKRRAALEAARPGGRFLGPTDRARGESLPGRDRNIRVSRKPNSVGLLRGDHLSGASVAGAPRCDRPRGDGEAGHTSSPLCGLAPGGVCRAGSVTGTAGALLPHRFTLARCARMRRPLAVCSLLHFPWARAPWELPSTLPFGVRTFLDRRPRPPLARKRRHIGRDHLGDSEPRTLSSVSFTSRSAWVLSSRRTDSNLTSESRAAASPAAWWSGFSPAFLTR
jgi:hypothetical protein